MDENTTIPSAVQMDKQPRRTMIMNDEQYIRERLDNQLEYFEKKSSEKQKKFKYYQRIEFIIAASIPILISFSTAGIIKEASIGGYTLRLDFILELTAAIAGVIVVIIKKVIELEEFYKLWKDYRIAAEELKQEKIKYLTKTEPYDLDNAFNLLVENTESIIAKDIQSWRKPQGKQSEKSETEKAESKKEV